MPHFWMLSYIRYMNHIYAKNLQFYTLYTRQYTKSSKGFRESLHGHLLSASAVLNIEHPYKLHFLKKICNFITIEISADLSSNQTNHEESKNPLKKLEVAFWNQCKAELIYYKGYSLIGKKDTSDIRQHILLTTLQDLFQFGEGFSKGTVVENRKRSCNQ